jgi:hypothetical protein
MRLGREVEVEQVVVVDESDLFFREANMASE